MTTQIVAFMHAMERTWDRHCRAVYERRDLGGALADLAGSPSVLHQPTMTGASGADDLRRFYAEQLLPHLPADLTFTRVSRTTDRWRVVDENTVSFTHDIALPWLLPGIEPTGREVQVLAITVVSFDRGTLWSQRTLWDHATLTAQLGVEPLLPAARIPT